MSKKNQVSPVIAQGDVMLFKVAALPKSATLVKADAGRSVLAYGEVTGHAHAVSSTDSSLFRTEDNRTFLQITSENAVLRHEEHNHIPLGSPEKFVDFMKQQSGVDISLDQAKATVCEGVYEIRHQREYSRGAIRSVAD